MRVPFGRLFAVSFLCTVPYFLYYGNVQIPNRLVKRTAVNPKLLFYKYFDNYIDERLRPQNVLLSPAENYCDGLDFIVGVHTRASDSWIRQVWRDTYGKLRQKYNFKLLFPVGLVNHNPPLANESLASEQRFHGDILQHDYKDAYRNLTYKHASLLRYYVNSCSSNVTLLKIDDDITWKVKEVSKFIKGFKEDKTSTLSCYAFSHGPVRKNGKWKTTEQEYSGTTYPEFCAGFAYFMTRPMAEALLAQLPKMKFFWIDDAFFTGIVRNSTGINLKKLNDIIKPKGDIKKLFSNGTIIYLSKKNQIEKYFYEFN